MFKKIVLVLLSLAIIASGVKSFLEKRSSEKVLEAEMSEIQLQIDELKLEKEDLLSQLAEYQVVEEDDEERADRHTISLLPQFTFAFASPQNYLYDDVYPALQEISLNGVLIFQNGQLPGENDGDLSTKRVETMVSDGWRVALGSSDVFEANASEEENMEKFREAMTEYKTKMKAISNADPDICYFPEGTYHDYLDEVLEDLGFTTIICENAPADVLHSNQNAITAYGYTKLEAFFEADECERKQFLLFDMASDAAAESAYSTKNFNNYLNSILDLEDRKGVTLMSVKELLHKAQDKEDEDVLTVGLSETEIEIRLQEIEDEIYALYH